MKRVVKPSESASTAVKRIVAELENCRPSQLGTLEKAVDSDDLNALVESADAGRTIQTIEFQYCGYLIEVNSDRTIIVEN